MKKENNKKIGFVIGGIVVLIGVFYCGMVYGKSIKPAGTAGLQAFGGARGTRGGGGGGFTTGEILSKDDKSITLKLMNGGSKIIFLDANTKISKSVSGSTADLSVGTQVSVMGAANTDGSVNAQSVQIRPNTALPVVK
jgi:hypothetical protein